MGHVLPFGVRDWGVKATLGMAGTLRYLTGNRNFFYPIVEKARPDPDTKVELAWGWWTCHT